MSIAALVPLRHGREPLRTSRDGTDPRRPAFDFRVDGNLEPSTPIKFLAFTTASGVVDALFGGSTFSATVSAAFILRFPPRLVPRVQFS